MENNTSQRLKELMEYFRINQSDLANKTGIPKSSISMYVSGERKPKQDRITDIAEAYGVNEAWLIGYPVPMMKDFSCEEGEKDSEILHKISLLTQRDKDIVLKIIDTMISQNVRK